MSVNQVIGSTSVVTQQDLEDDVDSDGSDFEHLDDLRRTDLVGTDVVENKFNLPKPIYDEVINIGNVSGIAKIDQVLEQLYIN